MIVFLIKINAQEDIVISIYYRDQSPWSLQQIKTISEWLNSQKQGS